ncbi:MAG: 6-bladed beta-propeller, partial [Tannerellaceae bacterium]
CSGKYWVDLLVPFSEDNWIDIDAVKASTVIDEAKKEAFVNCLENVNEDSNPILLIGVLK